MTPRTFLFLALGVSMLPLPLGAADMPAAYLDPAQPMEARVKDLVSRLTLEEKASLTRNGNAGVPRLGIPAYDWWNEALHGVARAGEATVFPQAIGLAATWDEPLFREMAGVIGVEARAKHHESVRQGRAGERYFGLTFWTPNINIFRDPRWGRGQETYGEDPFLTSRLGVAFVRGLQGDDPRHLLAAACAKHFAVHSGPEPLRHHFNVDPDEADFFETYLPAFEALVREARVESVMTAYNAVYGKPCAVSDRLYDLLYRSWGFDGHVVSDCGAIDDLYQTYQVAADLGEAEAQAISAGLCLRCGEDPSQLVLAVARGQIGEEVLDYHLGKLLRTMFRLGFFDPPGSVPYASIPFSENNSPAHAALALEAARKSIVLLRNDGLLPLDPTRLRRVAVIGPNAHSVPALLGNYNGTPSAPVTILAGLRAALAGATVDFAKGCDYVDQPAGLAAIPRLNLRYGFRTGLRRQFFFNTGLAGEPVETYRRVAVDDNWGGQPLPAGLPHDGFSVRWTGTLTSRLAGRYTLGVQALGGFRLFLGDELLFDEWSSTGETSRTLERTFADDETFPIRLEYRTAGGPARIALLWSTPPAEAGVVEALARAREADAIVFVGGLSADLEGEQMPVPFEGFEGGDRTAIELPAVQEKLLRELHATGKPVILVLMSGSAVASTWADENLPAIVQAWYPGQAGGTALADVLLGRTNPSGRLPVTFYRATTDLPPFADYHMAGRTYRYFDGAPLYAFGHGLSYTMFSYAKLRATLDGADPATVLSISVDVTNSGKRDGDEVVQIYAREPAAAHPRARQSLCGFRRIHLKAGETRTVTIPVPATALRRWDAAAKEMRVPSGEWQFRAGAASDDIRAELAANLD